MARRTAKPQEKEDDGEGDGEATSRDFVMARVCAARAYMRAADDALSDLEAMFLVPEEDRNGKLRSEALETALEVIGSATRSLESAEEAMPTVDASEGEPWEED